MTTTDAEITITRDKERITFTKLGNETNYRSVELTVVIEPGGQVGQHVHPQLDEKFVVTQGSLILTDGNQRIVLTPKNTDGHTVNAGNLHSWVNNSTETTTCDVAFIAPTYDELFDMIPLDIVAFLQTMFAMSNDGLFRNGKPRDFQSAVQISVTRWAFKNVSTGPSSHTWTIMSFLLALYGKITKVNPIYQQKTAQ